jgi:hypothetical protein
MRPDGAFGGSPIKGNWRPMIDEADSLHHSLPNLATVVETSMVVYGNNRVLLPRPTFVATRTYPYNSLADHDLQHARKRVPPSPPVAAGTPHLARPSAAAFNRFPCTRLSRPCSSPLVNPATAGVPAAQPELLNPVFSSLRFQPLNKRKDRFLNVWRQRRPRLDQKSNFSIQALWLNRFKNRFGRRCISVCFVCCRNHL